MNSRLPIYVLLPLVGFACGWWAKDGGVPQRANESGNSRTEIGIGQSLPAEEKSLQSAKRPRLEEDEESPEEEQRREEADRRYALTRSRKIMEVQLARWVRELSLDENQTAQVQSGIERIMKEQEASDEQASPAIDELEAVLNDLLDDAKAAKLEEIDERREEAVTSAKASSKLAEMQSVLELDGEDREKLYDHLLAGAGDLPPTGGSPAAGMSSAMLAEVTARVNARGADSSTFHQVAREVAKEMIEKELSALSGVLASDQLEAWRMHLEDENAQWLLGDL